MGSNTPEADAAGMGYTDGACYGDKVGNMACFLRERRRGNKGDERRTGPLDEAGVRRSCHQKKKERREKGGPVRETRRESREPTGCWEKEKRIVHKDGEHCTMTRPRKNGMLQILTQTTFVGHAAK